MGILDNLKKAGYKPKASQDGIWEPYTGVYKLDWVTCRKEIDAKNGNVAYIQAEWNILETLAGTDKRPSKYADFRKRYYIEGEKAEENMQKFLDDAFTFGIDLSDSSDESSLEGRFGELVGRQGFGRAWAWTPDDAQAAKQMFTLTQEKQAMKAVSKIQGSQGHPL